MKRTLAALTVLAAAFLVTPLTAPEAQAGGGIYVQIGDHGNNHHQKKHWQNRHRHKKHWHNHHNNRHWGGFVLNLGTPYYQPQPQPCQAVERDGYFRGRYAHLGETICYNGHGRAYVVEGSTYVLYFY